MPTLNTALLGLYAHGVAGDGGLVAVNGATIAGPHAGGHPDLHGPDWFTSTEVLCKTYPPEQLVAVDWQTGMRTVLYDGAVSDFVGGGGRWAALCYDGVVRVGSRTGVEDEYRNEIAPVAFGPDGAFACKWWHQDGLVLDGLELVPPHIRVEDVQVFNVASCLYRLGRTVHTYGLSIPAVTLPYDCGWVRGLLVGSRLLLALQRYGYGVVCFYSDDPTRGWWLGPDPCYRLDLGLLGGDQLRAIWSTVSRDHYEDLRGLDWSFADPLGAFDPTDPPIDPIDPIDPEVPVAIPNRSTVVHAVNAAHPELLRDNTLESCGIFTERVVLDLAAQYPAEGWGHVAKTGGQTQYRGHAADAIMSQLDLSKAIDIVGGAENHPHPGSPAWMEVTSGGQPWMAPIPLEEGSGGDGGGSGGGEVPSDLEARVAALEAQLTALEQSAVQYGGLIGLRCNNGTVVAIMPDGGPSQPYEKVVFESRDGVGPWESLKVERGHS